MCNNNEHEFMHLDTQYLYYSRSFGLPTYSRIDRFYCAKCCEQKEVVKSETTSYQPSWFDSKNYRNVRD